MGKVLLTSFSRLLIISVDAILQNSNLFVFSLWEKLGASHEASEEHQKRSAPVFYQQKIREINSKGSAIAKQIVTEDDADSLERHSR